MPQETETFRDVWYRRPYRMVQTNLRQPDARYDQRALAREVRAFGANVLLYNIGGIWAFYPTKLPLQAVNPWMQGDALGAAVDAAHAEGLALVGRFDMSKATRIAYEAHPDWFVHNRAGQPLEYNGTYQACVNGGWYQDYAKEIISEALSAYDVDGVFFNMFGYRNFNYSGDYFGICVCGNCRRRFHEMYGRALPAREDFADPAYADYLEFQDRTSLDLNAAIYDHIKAVNPRVAMTGHRGKSDLIRLEVQRAVERPQPEWPYQAGEQARWGRAIGGDKTVSSTSTNFVDFAWRFHAETAGYHLLRFAQQLASGATLDLYLLGVLDQEDKRPLAAVSELFHWHAANEAHYAGLTNGARIGLYHSRKTFRHQARLDSADIVQHCFRGAYRMLAEERLPFALVSDDIADAFDGARALEELDALLLPNVSCLSDREAAVLDAFVRGGGTLVATGDTGLYDHRGERRSAPALDALPVNRILGERRAMKGSYFRIREGELPLPDSRLVMLDRSYYLGEAKPGAEAALTLLPPQRFGPPELCFPDAESNWPGILAHTHGRGRGVWIPWNPDWQYQRDSLPSHRVLVVDQIRGAIPPAPAVLEGAGAVELTVQHQAGTGRTIVHVVNFAGQRNNLYEDAPELHGLRLGVRGATGPGTALRTRATLPPETDTPDADGYLWYRLPPVAAFEAVSFGRLT